MPPAVILAAGESSRFWPLSTHGHKALHRLRGQAIIEHTVESLVSAGVAELIIVQSPIARAAHFPHRTVEDQLGDGGRYGAAIRYAWQPEPLGQGDAILKASRGLKNDFLIVQPENINAGAIVTELLRDRLPDGAVAGHTEAETSLFGVFEVAEGRLRNFVEKPAPGSEPSKLCNTGVWLVGQRYLAQLRATKPDVLSNIQALIALARQHSVAVVETAHPFFPLKYPWHLFAMAEYLGRDDDGPYVGPDVTIAGSATLTADCVIEADAVIGENVRLRECLVGAGSRVDASLTSSIIGAAVFVEAGVTVKQRAVNHESVVAEIKGKPVDTGRPRLGAIVGQGTTIQGGTAVSPGILIGAESEVGPGEVTGNLGDRTRFPA